MPMHTREQEEANTATRIRIHRIVKKHPSNQLWENMKTVVGVRRQMVEYLNLQKKAQESNDLKANVRDRNSMDMVYGWRLDEFRSKWTESMNKVKELREVRNPLP